MLTRRQAFGLGFLISAFGIPSIAWAGAHAIQWHNAPDRALTVARELGRPVLIYFQSPNCGYCRKMERDSWSDPTVTRSVMEGFVPLKIDGEQNPAWLDRFGINGFPSVVVLSSTGEVKLRVEGYQPPRVILRRLNASTR